MATPSAKPFKKLSTNPRILHAPFYPADVRVGERVSATVSVEGSDEEHQLRVWRISPLGVELLVEGSTFPVKPGGRVNLSLKLGGQVANRRLVPHSLARRGTEHRTDPPLPLAPVELRETGVLLDARGHDTRRARHRLSALGRAVRPVQGVGRPRRQ